MSVIRLSLFLKRGDDSDFFHAVRKRYFSIDWLIRFVIVRANSVAPNVNNFGGISSLLVAFVGSVLFSRSLTSFTVVAEKLNLPSRGTLEVIHWIISQSLYVHSTSSIVSSTQIGSSFPIFEAAFMKYSLKILQTFLLFYWVVYEFIFVKQRYILVTRLAFVAHIRFWRGLFLNESELHLS